MAILANILFSITAGIFGLICAPFLIYVRYTMRNKYDEIKIKYGGKLDTKILGIFHPNW